MNSKWLMVVIGWGIVWPIVAIGASYAASWGIDRESSRPGCELSGSRPARRGCGEARLDRQPLEPRTTPKEPVKQGRPDGRDWHAAGGVREGGSLTTSPITA